MITLLLIAFILIIALGTGVVIYFSKPRNVLTDKRKAYYLQCIVRADASTSKERIFEYDKILHHILRDAGFRGNVGDQLKAKPKMLTGYLNEVWRLHKIRNHLAHEMHHGYTEKYLFNQAEAYRSMLSKILL